MARPQDRTRAAIEADARAMLIADGADPQDPQALRRLLQGDDTALERVLFTRGEVCHMMAISLSTYLRMHADGEGPMEVNIAGALRIPRGHFHAWLIKRDMDMASALASVERLETLHEAIRPRSVTKVVAEKINGRTGRRRFLRDAPVANPGKKKANNTKAFDKGVNP